MKSGEWVERCIYHRGGSDRYAVHIRLNMTYHSRTFDTLEEARAFRAEIESKRRKRERVRRDIVKGYDLDFSAEKSAEREKNREQIRKAKRSTRIVGGKKFMVVHL